MAKTRRRRRLIAGLAGAAALAGLATAALAARHFGGGSGNGDFGLPRRLPTGARDDLTWIHTAMEDDKPVTRAPARAPKRGRYIAPAPRDEPLPDGWFYNDAGVPVNLE
jgi:hypothetical protein